MHHKLRTVLIIAWALGVAGAACQSRSQVPAGQGGTPVSSFPLSSSAFNNGGTIPTKYTCNAENLSPPLSWSGVPPEAKSLALIVDDPDSPGKTWVHWVYFNIEPTRTEIPEGVTPSSGIGTDGNNDFRKRGYGGPCPPAGKPHRYFFKLYALDSVLSLKSGAARADLERAMSGHILAQGELMGTYGR